MVSYAVLTAGVGMGEAHAAPLSDWRSGLTEHQAPPMFPKDIGKRIDGDYSGPL
jgi:hypothetical protein